jgi:hypothetical protein
VNVALGYSGDFKAAGVFKYIPSISYTMYKTESTTKVSPRSSKGSLDLQFAQGCILELNRLLATQRLCVSFTYFTRL